MNFFDHILLKPPDPIFGLAEIFRKDPRPEKLTFITGYFRDENLETPVLDTVHEVEKELAEARLSRKYLPIVGDEQFCHLLGELVFGDHWNKEQFSALQTVGGTGALFLAGNFFKGFLSDKIAVSDPSWVNHSPIFQAAGLNVELYPYYANKKLQFEALIDKFHSLPEKTAVLLHTNCHNTSGFDLSKEQWKQLSELFKRKKLFPLFDMAYQGFSAEPAEDAFAPRYFLEQGHELALTYTCAKNFSIYSERVGALFFYTRNKERKEAIESELKTYARTTYSNPPIHGVSIVKRILSSNELKKRWLEELRVMRNRMFEMRSLFYEALCKKKPGADWEFIKNGKGLFCLLDLDSTSLKRLRDEKAIYLAGRGRFNVTGLNEKNLDFVVSQIINL